MRILKIETRSINDWDSFHDFFQRAMGFPGFYGRNMDAWIDCMTRLDEPDAGLTQVAVEPGELLLLEIPDTEGFKERCPEQFEALLEGAAFVNRRRLDAEEKPVLALLPA